MKDKDSRNRQEDFISDLFRKNAQKLDQAPRPEVWQRLSARLAEQGQEPALAAQPKNLPNRPFGRWRVFMAAASVLALAVSVGLLFHLSQEAYQQDAGMLTQKQSSAKTEKQTSPQSLEAEEDEDAEVLALLEERQSEQAFEEAQEDKKQAARLIEKAQKKNKNVESLDAVEFVELPSKVELPKLEERKAEEKPRDTAPQNFDEASEFKIQAEAFSAPPPAPAAPATAKDMQPSPRAASRAADPALNTNQYGYEQEQLEKTREEAYVQTKELEKAKRRPRNSSPNRIRNRKTEAADVEAQEELGQLNVNLHQFAWLLGSWTDKGLSAGLSHERWYVADQYTIACQAYKELDGDRIFQEELAIRYDAELKQIFFLMPLEEKQKPLAYMLSRLSGEQLLFIQKDNGKAPDQLIIQRETNGGFSLRLKNSNGLLNSSQQSYLQNRNRVSNLRAVRILEPAN